MLHNDYNHKSSVAKLKTQSKKQTGSGCDPQGDWDQDELIGGKPPIVK
jgi:hypothetical protein